MASRLEAALTQITNHILLNQSISDIESLGFLFNAYSSIFGYNFFHFFDEKKSFLRHPSTKWVPYGIHLLPFSMK